MSDISANFEDALTQSLKGVGNLTSQYIAEFAAKLAPVYGVSEDKLAEIVRNIETKLVTTMNEGISLIDEASEHDEEWNLKREDITWNYWNDYEKHLIAESWGPRVVNTMGDVTGKILGLLKNPEDMGDWKRRGLVIGHVQSGKTANYIGLISKAADAGYKFIIVIAGIHNNLRTQTQQRVDEGFIGRNSDPNRRGKPLGVGLIHPNRRFPVTLTTTDKDFDKHIANQLGADLQVYKQPVVVVIKKNVTTLKRLYAWLKEWNTRESTDKIDNIPMLMIDDEADNASINTKKEDLDPTATNREIRNILSLFRKSCYVGYTATPFANIFINPDTEDEMLGHDLFPRDFIYCLDAPTNYFGPHKMFVDEEASQTILRTIDDAEDIIPLKHKKDHSVSDLPASLKKAIHAFIVGKSIRIVRKHRNKHASMMVNVSRFVDVQRQLREHISLYLKEMKNALMCNYALPESSALKDAHMRSLRKIYDEEFSAGDESWQDIQKVLYEAADAIKIYLVNSKSDEALDYRWAEENDESLTALAIGGLSLSRGLTLEGLMVSYMYRNTKMYDTLMQMGRWFGYRAGYEDTCRVYLLAESQGWYSHIAEASEELRQQIKQMRRDRLGPTNFGLYVRAHPDTLLVTALNKMRDAERKPYKINLSGTLTETFIVPSDPAIVSQNQELMRKLFSSLEQQYSGRKKNFGKSHFWEAVDWERAEEFLMEFKFHQQIQAKKNAALDYLRKVSVKYPAVDISFISLDKSKVSSTAFRISGAEILYCQERAVGTSATGGIKEPIEEKGFFITNKQRVASRGAESIGLNDILQEQAEASAKEDGLNVADKYYRLVRPRPLVMLHVLNLVHKIKNENREELLLDQVPAMGISFPGGDYSITVDYVVNRIWLKQLQEEAFDNPDDEEDYDS